MILDTSAVVAIVMKEPGHEALLRTMANGNPAIGTATLTETAIVLAARLESDVRSLLARFLSEASIAIVPFGESHYSAAVARLANEPLLFAGDDFAQTDIARC